MASVLIGRGWEEAATGEPLTGQLLLPPIGVGIGPQAARDLFAAFRDVLMVEVRNLTFAMRLQGVNVHSWRIYGPAELQADWSPAASTVELAEILVSSRHDDRTGLVTLRLDKRSGQLQVCDLDRILA